jgi:hypothetical protein
MGSTHAEFFRLLPLALASDDFAVHDYQVVHQFDNKRVEIDLGPEGKRQIALLAIPSTPVEIRMSGFSDQEFDSFMTRFERAFQRGGG